MKAASRTDLHFRISVLFILSIFLLPNSITIAQQQPLDPWGLTRLRQGQGARSSSSAEDWDNSKGDARKIRPGQTLLLAELTGPGMVRHIWNTVNAVEFGASRNLVLRMSWDGEDSPSVEVPLGDLFGVGHGMNVNFD